MNRDTSARAEAAAWITRLHGPSRTAEMEAGFQRWLKERPENAEEFEGLTEIWDLVASTAPARSAQRHEPRERSQPASRMWLAAAVVLFMLGALTVTVWRISSDTKYVTGIGEQRIVQLDDGTRISLNSDSELSPDYDKQQRRVVLLKGEALFEVAKRPGWPFVVTAGDEQITALGTSFVVRKDADRTAVTLIEGKISISSPKLEMDSPVQPAAPKLLSPGQRLTVAGATAKLDRPAVEAVTAWRRGEVALDDTPLAEAVAEMNRHDKTRIVIADPSIDNLIVSGLYHTGDNQDFARSIAAMYRLKATERDGQIVLER